MIKFNRRNLLSIFASGLTATLLFKRRSNVAQAQEFDDDLGIGYQFPPDQLESVGDSIGMFGERETLDRQKVEQDVIHLHLRIFEALEASGSPVPTQFRDAIVERSIESTFDLIGRQYYIQ